MLRHLNQDELEQARKDGLVKPEPQDKIKQAHKDELVKPEPGAVHEEGLHFGFAPTATYPVYATVGDVEALNRARTFDTPGSPTGVDVQKYLEWVAAEINEILADKGYTVPIEPTSVNAEMLLSNINAKGAICYVEKASPSSTKLKEFEEEYAAQLAKLKAADFSLDSPKNDERAKPRGPGVTTAPGVLTNLQYEQIEAEEEAGLINESTQRSIPFFRRGMKF